MSDPQLVGLGLLVFIAAGALHGWLWQRSAAPGLRSADPAQRAAALKAWLRTVLVIEVGGLVLVGAWLLLGPGRHPLRLAWLAPPVGLLAGNGLPLQLAVLGITRSARAAR